VAVRPIVLYPDPVLLRPTRPVEAVDPGLRDLIRDLIDTMHAAPGIGLAANQVGEGRRVCVVDLSVGETAEDLKVLVNPRVVAVQGSQVDEEGCLSFPDITLEVERAAHVTVEALDREGRPFTLTAEGLLARAVLHEIEHLDGQTFLRNVSPLKRQLVTRQIRKRMKSGDWVAVPAER
jgi:peptide deformylase